MRLVKLTGTDDKVRHVNPDHVEMLWPKNEETTVLVFSTGTCDVQGTPAEVARLLAGGEGDGGARLAELEDDNKRLRAEVERLKGRERGLLLELEQAEDALGVNTRIEMDPEPLAKTIAALKRERDEARAALGNPVVLAAIRLANAYVEFEPGDDATELDSASFAYERLRDEAPASPAPEPEPDDRRALLETALRALVLTHQYAPETLPPIAGWEWYDAARKLAAALPGSEWAGHVPAAREPEPDDEGEETDDEPAGEAGDEGGAA